MSDWTTRELHVLTQEHLESLYVRPQENLSPPKGVWRGHWLTRIDNEGSRRPLWFWGTRLGFEWTPFGIDFDRRLWFFFNRGLALGRFDARPGPSRWRETDTIQLHYDPSRLPSAIRHGLYDEVKPLSPRWMIGIGGVNAGRGIGDHFYFALERA